MAQPWETTIHTTPDTALANALYEILEQLDTPWLKLKLVRDGRMYSVLGETAGVLTPSQLQPGPRAAFDEGLSHVQLVARGFLAGWIARVK